MKPGKWFGSVKYGLTILFLSVGAILPAQVGDQDLNRTAIHVEGKWTLDILEADGTLVKSHRFFNALVNPGALTGLINGDASAGGTYVVLANQTPSSGICGNQDCEITDGSMMISITPDATNLQKQITGNDFETLRLTGFVTASNSGSIDVVRTWILLCGSKTPADCKASPDSESVLTAKTLGSPIAVSQGQIVQFTVDLTFN